MVARTLLVIALVILTSSASYAKQTILVIESYHAAHPWGQGFNRGIADVIDDKYHIDNFYMDTKRLPPSQYAAQAEAAWQKYQAIKPPLVILTDDNALKYLGKKFETEPILVVYLGINANPRSYISLQARNITGVIERPLLTHSLAHLSRILKPAPKKVLVLFDDGTTSQVMRDGMGGKQFSISDIDVTVSTIGSWTTWQETVLNAKKDGFDAIITGLYHTIKDNNEPVKADDIITWTSAHSEIPLFAFWSFSIGKDKAAGGLVLDGYFQGELAAQIALKGLADGRFKTTFPQIAEKGTLMFSETQLEKWRIVLPPEMKSRAILVK
ncbi:hypothetical protein M9194_18945 [Vibrio sp. S4M6]|uniref:ABC transporter substrate-binding protein n=1 Tax=Vibrio sinus TaxID=2946865 RepID=UPI002029C4EB|nr:hypothetical protein [Vibrio sinus]MCL9783508.1 hypothetical protein [Vibrio sinus]